MPPPVEFREDEKHQLVVDYRPDADAAAPPSDGPDLAALAGAAGYGELQLDAVALAAAAQSVAAGKAFSAVVGRRTDAQYRVDVAADKMSASLTVTAPHGGTVINADDARAALGAKGVVFGIDEAAVARALAAPGTAVDIARGQLPQAGVDGRLETLIHTDETHRPLEDEKGHVDFRERGIVRWVEIGAPLMRRHPPRPGVPGRTVTGADVAVATPKDAKLPGRAEGVGVSSGDPDLLVAEIAGHPVIRRDGIRVEPTLKLDKVDLSSGNIDFVGTVEVTGDVQSGMKIKASGDVIIHGVLESAEVEAGNDIVVLGGIVGQMPVAAARDEAERKAAGAHVHAHANVRARHVKNAVILAEQSVFIDEVAVQCDITAIDQVVIGKEGGRKGHVLGGVVRATKGIVAECLGGLGTGETRLLIGVNPLTQKALDAMKAAIAARTKERDDLEKVVKLLQNRSDRREILDKARLTLERTLEELESVTADAQALEGELKEAESATVVVKHAVFPGVVVGIGRKYKRIAEERGPGTFKLATETNAGKEEVVIAYE